MPGDKQEEVPDVVNNCALYEHINVDREDTEHDVGTKEDNVELSSNLARIVLSEDNGEKSDQCLLKDEVTDGVETGVVNIEFSVDDEGNQEILGCSKDHQCDDDDDGLEGVVTSAADQI